MKRLLCYNIRMNKNTSIILIAVALIIGLAGGYFAGVATEKKTTEKFRQVAELVFPAPAEEMFSITGTLKSAEGNTLTVEVRDPDDYLPRTDGTAPKTEIRTVTVTEATKILSIDITKIDENGDPAITEIQASDLAPGTALTVRSDANIRDAMAFSATQIETVVY